MGDGVGSAIARGWGAGRVGAFATAFLVGVGGVGGAGGVGSTFGEGGSMNWDSTSAGTIISAARMRRPLCSAQMNATCKAITAIAMAALRLNGGVLCTWLSGPDIPGGSPKDGMLWIEGSTGAFMGDCVGSVAQSSPVAGRRPLRGLFTAKDPPRRTCHQYQADRERCTEGLEKTCDVGHSLP